MTKKLLITGGAGFIGSAVIRHIINNTKHSVVNVDKLTYAGNLESLVSVENDSRYVFEQVDICDANEIKRVFNEHQPDIVMHLAALGSVPRSIENPINANRANIDGFLNMLVASKDANVKRFVYAASSSTYGDHPALPKVEDKIGSPLSPYAVTKVVNELYASVFAKTYGFKTIGLRYFNIFGKRQNPNGAYAAVIPKWVAAILNKDDVYINGDGETSRDFCYVDNAVQMNLLAATTDNDDATDQVYNVALNDRTSLNKLYQMIKERLIQRIEGLEKKEPVYRDFREGDVRHSQANIDKAQALLDYQPKYMISEGMDKAIDWYVSSLTKFKN